jgi:hypothetical protein
MDTQQMGEASAGTRAASGTQDLMARARNVAAVAAGHGVSAKELTPSGSRRR